MAQESCAIILPQFIAVCAIALREEEICRPCYASKFSWPLFYTVVVVYVLVECDVYTGSVGRDHNMVR